MNCIVIENDLVQLNLLLHHIEETSSLNFIGSYESSISAIMDLPNIDVDIIFLDVEMPGMSGFDFLEYCKLPDKTKVIITTSHQDYALEAFNHDVTDFLLKPISYARFLKAVNKVQAQSKPVSALNDFLFIKSKGVQIKLEFKDILWIKSADEYVILYTRKGKHMVYSSMKAILDKLPDYFIRVHRSNIVALNKIEKIHNNIIEINGHFIKISKGYKDDVKELLGI